MFEKKVNWGYNMVFVYYKTPYGLVWEGGIGVGTECGGLIW